MNRVISDRKEPHRPGPSDHVKGPTWITCNVFVHQKLRRTVTFQEDLRWIIYFSLATSTAKMFDFLLSVRKFFSYINLCALYIFKPGHLCNFTLTYRESNPTMVKCPVSIKSTKFSLSTICRPAVEGFCFNSCSSS